MKKMILLLLMISMITTAHSQIKQKNKLQYATIRFTYEMSLKPDTLALSYWHDGWYQISTLPRIEAKSNGLNNFRVEFKNAETVVNFYAVNVRKTGQSGLLNAYILEPNDNVVVNINKDGKLLFTGKGSEKFKLIYEITQAADEPATSFFKENGARLWNAKVKDITNYQDKLKAIISTRDFKIKAMEIVIGKFIKKVTPSMLDLIKANFLGQYEYETASSYAYLNTDFMKTELSKSSANIEYLSSIYFGRKKNDFENLNKSALGLSYGYQDYLYFISRKSKLFKNSGFDYLQSFSGTLRDRLLTIFIMNEIYHDTMNKEWLNNALKIVKTDYCKKILLNLANSAYPGKAAFPFSLKDTTGNTVTMASLKGKVVLLDFYFTGCSGCRNLNEKMSKTYEKFKNNNNIAFISVSIDKNFETWKKSVKSHLYSHEGSTNLYTNGIGTGHPIIRHYGIGAYPTVVLIGKDGKIISANPPKPYDLQKENDLVALLTKSIKD